jgi:hypothetical protein
MVRVLVQPVHHVAAGSAGPVPPYSSWATAARTIQEAVDAATALPGALVLVTNGVYASGGRAVYGTMTNRVAVDGLLTVRSVNGPGVTVIEGYQVPGTTNGDGAIRCVYLTNGAVLSGFTLTNGATRTINDYPSNRESSGGGLWCESTNAVISNCVLVGNSAYSGGGGAYRGTLNNCTLTGNSASAGGGACDGTLNNCTLTGNSANSGGGAYEGTLDNCTLTGNWAVYGGGVSGIGFLEPTCRLKDCTLTGNSATDSGGGAYRSELNNCTITGSTANSGGGAFQSTLHNCTLVGNLAWVSGGGVANSGLVNSIVAYNASWTGANHTDSTLDYCCTSPLPTGGRGNIAVPPLFVDYASANLRLQSNSPCINAGLNAYAPGPMDLDGNPRIVRGTVDIGAYEFQGPGSVISYAWLQQYGLSNDGSADFTDPDADGHTTWQEWRCLTDPTNVLSVLRLLSASRAGTNVTVTWQSVAGVSYFLERSTNLSATPPFTPLATGIPGQTGTTSFTDSNAALAPRLFYRVGVP